MSQKEEMLALLQRARDEEQAFIDRLGQQEREANGDPDEWAPKDTLAHIAVWKHITAGILAAGVSNRPITIPDDIDRENKAIFLRYQGRSWDSIVQIMGVSYRELVERVTALSEADLTDVDKFPWLEGRSFLARVVDTACFHPIWHVSLMYFRRGDHDLANTLIREISEKLLALDVSPHWRGYYQYNLACYYALTGDNARAIESLRPALALRPELIEWSRTDRDLAPLWDEPGYAELVEE